MQTLDFNNRIITNIDYFQLEKKPLFHTEFDSLDFGISLTFDSQEVLTIQYGESHFFEFHSSDFKKPSHLENLHKTKVNERWSDFLDLPLKEIDLFYQDAFDTLISSIVLSFQNDTQISIILAEPLDSSNKIKLPLNYLANGNLYVIFNPDILNPPIKASEPSISIAPKEEEMNPKSWFSKLSNFLNR